MNNAIHLRFFGRLAEITQTAAYTLNDDVQDTDTLVKRVVKKYPLLADYTYAIAVDKKIITDNTALKNGQTIAFMPPYSGG
jgi:molybdopterin converting factor small subunit